MNLITPSPDWRTHRPFLWPSILLWAWQMEFLWLGLVIAVLLELPRLLPHRLEISQGDFDRMWNFTAVLFLAVLFYLGLSNQGLYALGLITGETLDGQWEGGDEGMHRASGTALTILRCLPGILAPFIATVVWSHSTVLPWSTFSLYEQARAKRQPLVPPAEWTRRPMHPGYLFIAVSLFSAGMSSLHQQWFLPLFVLALLIALHPVRTRGHGVVAWINLVVFLGAVSLGARYGREMMQFAWSQLEERLLRDGLPGDDSPLSFSNYNQTSRSLAFGDIGTLKQSGTVMLRITTSDGNAPGLLREASMNCFRGFGWDIIPRMSETAEVVSTQAEGQTLTITRTCIEGQAPLAVPGDTAQVIVVPPAQVVPVGLGALRVFNAPPIASYIALRGKQKNCLDELPEPEDLRLDPLRPKDVEILDWICHDLGLNQELSANEAGQRLEYWFANNFTYSLTQAEVPPGISPLANFLIRTRSGHCEFFATASVLILRNAGFLARYAVGFSVNEWMEDRWLARGRDAHAWTLVWDGSRWQDLDTTPGTWRGVEAATVAKPWHEAWTDAWSEWLYRFALWRQEGGSWQILVFVTGTVVLIWIAWRQLRGSTWGRVQKSAQEVGQITRLGMDSKAIALWERLGRHHEPRNPAETVRDWLKRIGLLYAGGTDLDELVELHDRLRFDPAGLSKEQRHRLEFLVDQFQERIPSTGVR